MKILHFGDIHVWRLRLASDFWYPKRLLGIINLTARRRFKFPSEIPSLITAEITRQDADTVIFSGDMSTMSLHAEFAEAARLFEPIHKKWGDNFFCIPGNHDRYSPHTRQGLYEHYFPYGAFPKGHHVRSHQLRDGLAIVGFDCSHPCKIRSNGTLTPALEAQIRQELDAQKAANNKVILTGHYPYVYPADVHASWEHKLLQADRLTRIAADYAPILYLHGHKHQRWLLHDPDAPKTLCVNCGASGMTSSDQNKQAGFVTIQLNDQTLDPVSVTAHILTNQTFTTQDLPLP
jgi:3',5'-cyclic AMP phosphodiesterase CpdA